MKALLLNRQKETEKEYQYKPILGVIVELFLEYIRASLEVSNMETQNYMLLSHVLRALKPFPEVTGVG